MSRLTGKDIEGFLFFFIIKPMILLFAIGVFVYGLIEAIWY